MDEVLNSEVSADAAELRGASVQNPKNEDILVYGYRARPNNNNNEYSPDYSIKSNRKLGTKSQQS